MNDWQPLLRHVADVTPLDASETDAIRTAMLAEAAAPRSGLDTRSHAGAVIGGVLRDRRRRRAGGGAVDRAGARHRRAGHCHQCAGRLTTRSGAGAGSSTPAVRHAWRHADHLAIRPAVFVEGAIHTMTLRSCSAAAALITAAWVASPQAQQGQQAQKPQSRKTATGRRAT